TFRVMVAKVLTEREAVAFVILDREPEKSGWRERARHRYKCRREVAAIDEHVDGCDEIDRVLPFSGEIRLNFLDRERVVDALCARLPDHCRGDIASGQEIDEGAERLAHQAGAAAEIEGAREMERRGRLPGGVRSF